MYLAQWNQQPISKLRILNFNELKKSLYLVWLKFGKVLEFTFGCSMISTGTTDKRKLNP